MARRLIEFPCAGERLAATLDAAPGSAGLLIVSGGNELRIGAHRGMALLAQRIAAGGWPVFRYDRRGIGDSTGENRGFADSGADLAAAVAAFRVEAPDLTRILGFGNCDAATTLALFHQAAGIDALLLANPWLVENEGDTPPPAAVRARYAERLRDPRHWLRLLRGQVDLGKLARGVRALARPRSRALAGQVAASLAGSEVPVTLLLARRDNTAIACADAWRGPVFDPIRSRIPVLEHDTASHSFARAPDAEWLHARVREALG
ncbi:MULTISPECIES: hydrolase 1, exosortase A system-associated [Sphingomonas]|uniref:hydrolase 1, exosortase A system-associated n=1 Tax=Sphingomonas TaxID=13687 RepID=UPI000F7D941E|nr:hydrolase 1, exosortase A system-associated [Sphingomonas sp. ABOLF]RSV15754.1 hydrolase 1, exosortase A system-associated [Sphingomonas sp. ABOLF]GLK21201.1 hydrolase 1, exosortase A system-associated [Microbacterium terregens]